MRFVGPEIVEAVNIAGLAGNGSWPVYGGLMDQSYWFLELKRVLDSECSRIEAERANRNASV